LTVTGITQSRDARAKPFEERPRFAYARASIEKKSVFKAMDCRVTGERSDAVLRTAMPGN